MLLTGKQCLLNIIIIVDAAYCATLTNTYVHSYNYSQVPANLYVSDDRLPYTALKKNRRELCTFHVLYSKLVRANHNYCSRRMTLT